VEQPEPQRGRLLLRRVVRIDGTGAAESDLPPLG
jgi:hypothetical protein